MILLNHKRKVERNMKNAKIWLLIGVVVMLTAGVISKAKVEPSTEPTPQAQVKEVLPTFSQAVLQQGSYGEDVYELQGRLKYLGYYNGKVDSIFGTKTKNSVKWFQSEFGMKVDGIVGSKTKTRLYNATKDWRPTEPKLHEQGANQNQNKGKEEANLSSANKGFSDNDIKIMANAVYGESRGEPFEGQVAVAAVILNRVESPNFPNTPSGVIFQPRAFTAVADGQIWLEPNETAKKAVMQAINGWDPTGGCIYYFNPETATSEWIWSRPQVITIGQHIFCM